MWKGLFGREIITTVSVRPIVLVTIEALVMQKPKFYTSQSRLNLSLPRRVHCTISDAYEAGK